MDPILARGSFILFLITALSVKAGSLANDALPHREAALTLVDVLRQNEGVINSPTEFKAILPVEVDISDLVSNFNVRFQALGSNVTRLGDQLRIVEEENARVQNALKEEVAQCKEKLETCKSEKETCEEKARSAETAAQEKLTELETQLQASKEEVDGLRETIQRQQQQLKASNEQKSLVEKELAGLKGLVRHDGKCGPQNLIDGKPGQCNPYGNSPCCSPKGYCGITVDHCGGIDYRVKAKERRARTQAYVFLEDVIKEIDWNRGTAGASSVKDVHCCGASMAFEPDSSRVYWQSEENSLPATIWNKLPEPVKVTKWQFSTTSYQFASSRNDWTMRAPNKFQLVGSDDCKFWTNIMTVDLGPYKKFHIGEPAKEWDVPKSKRRKFRCMGIKVLTVTDDNGKGDVFIRWIRMWTETADLVRKDGRCGPDFPINGKPGQCSPYGNSGWCCSPHAWDYHNGLFTGGWCGSSWDHCKCANCIDYRKDSPADNVVSLPHYKLMPRPAPEGNCAAPRELVQVGNALRFGDHRMSCAVVNPYDVIGPENAKSFKKDFTFTFLFRTFYRNGILFYMEHKDHQKSKEVYITAYLLDGKVVLNFKQPKVDRQKKDQKGLMTEGETFADGKFHKVQIIKSGKTISLQVDDGPIMESKMKKSSENVEWSEKLKIGGPRTSMPFKVILYPLQGCIKEFRINDKLADMAANLLGENRHAKPCVSPADGDLVRGAHFSGQGYARLNDIFVIDDWLQIKLKFKTTSQEGVLLAMGDPEEPERPTLMLELFKGDLILRLHTKSGTGDSMVTFKSTYNKFKEGAEACDNEWHTVDARVVRTVLMLIVDGTDGITGFKSDAQQKHSGEIKQYVGGIPDNLRSTWPLKPLSSKNFRGCVSDVMIKDYEKYKHNVVWSLSSSSLKIHQVDISACP